PGPWSLIVVAEMEAGNAAVEIVVSPMAFVAMVAVVLVMPVMAGVIVIEVIAVAEMPGRVERQNGFCEILQFLDDRVANAYQARNRAKHEDRRHENPFYGQHRPTVILPQLTHQLTHLDEYLRKRAPSWKPFPVSPTALQQDVVAAVCGW